MRLVTRRLAALTRIEKVGLLLLGTAVLVALVGYLNQHGSLYLGESVRSFLQDYYANLSTELASIAITVLIINALYQQRDVEREKRDLILQMGSTDNAFAREAVRRLWAQGYLKDGTLSGAHLISANLNKADLREADLSRANLGKADLRGADLSRADLREASLFIANLDGARLVGANLGQADLRAAHLRWVDLGEASLRGADLSRADLREANLFSTDLREANLVSTDLRSVQLGGADLRGANVTDEQLAQAASLEGAIMPDGTKHE